MRPITNPSGTLFCLLSLTASFANAASDAPCYDPQGHHDPNALGFYPCQINSPVAACCPQGWTCFSNHYCVVTTKSNSWPNVTIGEVRRAMCTNPQWDSNACGDKCLDANNAAGEMAYCGNNRFCCAADYDAGRCDCSPNGNAFTISAGVAQTIIEVSDTSYTGTPTFFLPVTATHVSTTSGSASTAATTTAASTGSHSTTVFGSTGFLSTTAAPTGTGTPGDDTSSGDSNKNLKLGLGVGLGVGLGLLLIGAIVFFVVHRNRNRGVYHAPGENHNITEDLIPDNPHNGPKYVEPSAR